MSRRIASELDWAKRMAKERYRQLLLTDDKHDLLTWMSLDGDIEKKREPEFIKKFPARKGDTEVTSLAIAYRAYAEALNLALQAIARPNEGSAVVVPIKPAVKESVSGNVLVARIWVEQNAIGSDMPFDVFKYELLLGNKERRITGSMPTFDARTDFLEGVKVLAQVLELEVRVRDSD